MSNKASLNHKIAVIGGGPAGLMAAIRAQELGASVWLLEKNQECGLKLLLSGGGRCNVTNQADPKAIAAAFGPNGRWLLSALTRFSPSDLMTFFIARGLRLKTEAGGRVFPELNQARPVRQALVDYFKFLGGTIVYDFEVRRLVRAGKKIVKVLDTSGREFAADNFIIATGGKSYPLTGSGGAGYQWLKNLGHHIVPLAPALAPLLVSERFVQDLEGLSWDEISISLYRDGKKIDKQEGPVMFTARGLSGPLALNLSRQIARQPKSAWSLRLNFFPADDFVSLDQKLRELFQSNAKKEYKNILGQLLPPKMVPTIVTLSGINPERRGSDINQAERKSLGRALNDMTLSISGWGGYQEAMITVGGVDLKEVDPKTMKSKIIDNLYLAGEILDLDGPTGGFNLQACWSTGQAAGAAAAQ